jgi:hypothetical protein
MVREIATDHGWTAIGDAEWRTLIEAVPRVRTEDVRASGFPADPPWHGVALHNFEDLRNSLCALSKVYEQQVELREFCRREVIRAKDRARRISRSTNVTESVRQIKSEMVDWMLVWLGDPALFPVWSELRLKIRDWLKDALF